MNLGLHIFNFLQNRNSVELPGFGVFSILKKSAQLDESSSILLPPSQEISFVENNNTFSSDLSKYISEKTGENLFIVQSKLKDIINFWNQEINQNNKLLINELGEFYVSEGKILLKGKEDYIHTPKFFGLEKINLQNIKKAKNEAEDSENQYIFNYSILWIFLFILPVGALIFLGLKYQDKLLGKKSFEDISVKSSTHRIEKTSQIKDSINVKIEKLKVDSVKISK